jgi:hypothetical protein
MMIALAILIFVFGIFPRPVLKTLTPSTGAEETVAVTQ